MLWSSQPCISLYLTPEEDARFRELAWERKRSHEEVMAAFVRLEFNKHAANLDAMPILPRPTADVTKVLRTHFYKDEELHFEIRRLAFKKKTRPDQIYRSLLVAGLDWHDSRKAEDKPLPRIPLDHETRNAMKEDFRKLRLK